MSRLLCHALLITAAGALAAFVVGAGYVMWEMRAWQRQWQEDDWPKGL